MGGRQQKTWQKWNRSLKTSYFLWLSFQNATSIRQPYKMILVSKWQRFREFFARLSFRNLLSFSSAKNNAHISYHSLFEMMWALYCRSYMTRNMTIISKVSRGHQIPSPCKGLACHHFKKKVSFIYRNESQSIISKRKSIHHIERTVIPSFRNDSPGIISKR